jgi:hypothetical protein
MKPNLGLPKGAGGNVRSFPKSDTAPPGLKSVDPARWQPDGSNKEEAK